MKKSFIASLLLTGLLFLASQIYAGAPPGLTQKNEISDEAKSGKGATGYKELKEEKEGKEDKERKGAASRQDGFNGKSSRLESKHGKEKRY